MRVETVCASWNSDMLMVMRLSLAAVEQVRQRQRGLGLADAAGPHQQEHADGLVGIFQPGLGGANALADGGQGVVLSDHALTQVILQLENRLDLVLEHLADGDAGPAGNDFADDLGVHADPHQRLLSLQGGQL